MAPPRIALSLRDRIALVGRAISGTFDLDRGSVGGRLLSGVIPAGGQAPTRGTADYLKAYSSMPWLRAVASRVAYDVASTAWQVYVPRRAGAAVRDRRLQAAKGVEFQRLFRKAIADGELEELADHPLVALLDDFNPLQTGLSGRRVTQLHLDLVGEAFWLMERGPLGNPVALYPIPPHWVAATPTIDRPSFRVSFRSWQGEIPAAEWIWFADVNPADPYGRGIGTAQALADELETDEYTAKHIKSFYFNRARPDLIVSPKGDDATLRPEEVERLEESWTRHSGGFWRQFKPFFLRRAVDVQELSQSFQNQQLVELRGFERDTILQTFGVSPETLGILSAGSNRATVTMGDTIYAKRVLVPRLELIRAVLQERLLPLFDEKLVIAYATPVTADRELELDAAKVAPWALSVDEWRGRMGVEPLDDAAAGATHVGSITVAPMALGADADPVPPDEPQDDDDSGEEGGESAALARVAAKAGDVETARYLAKRASDDEPAPTRLAERQVVGYRRALETAWEALAARAAESELVRALGTRQVEEVVGAFGGMAVFERAVGDVASGKGRVAFLRGADLALHGLPPVEQREPIAIDLSAVNPEAVRWARERSARLVREVGPETRRAIQAIIASSTFGNLTPQQAARLIRQLAGLLARQVDAVARYRLRLIADELAAEVVDRRVTRYAEALRRKRAILIARTELIGATNAGQQALWELARNRGLLPKSMERVWLVTMDDLLDTEICLPLADVRAPFGQPFPGGFMQPPAHPGCRCAVGLADPRPAPRRVGVVAVARDDAFARAEE